ncbi:MAG: GatB/YqeY domain-containing protein [Tissierellia bacterium]|nr:GatB/YqeY domain-containing protein [Tissierellia bacterium]
MMLVEQLMIDLKAAMKAKNTVQKNTITMLRAAIKQIEVDERRSLDDEEIFSIIQKQIREKTKAIKDFQAGNRPDLIEEAESEIAILKDYLPEQMSEDDINLVIDQVIAVHGKQIGPVMKTLKQELASKADMALVNRLVREKLN